MLRRKKSKWAEARRNSFGKRSEGLRKVHTKSRFFGPHLKALPLLFRFLESVSLFEATPTTPFFPIVTGGLGERLVLFQGAAGLRPELHLMPSTLQAFLCCGLLASRFEIPADGMNLYIPRIPPLDCKFKIAVKTELQLGVTPGNDISARTFRAKENMQQTRQKEKKSSPPRRRRKPLALTSSLGGADPLFSFMAMGQEPKFRTPVNIEPPK